MRRVNKSIQGQAVKNSQSVRDRVLAIPFFFFHSSSQNKALQYLVLFRQFIAVKHHGTNPSLSQRSLLRSLFYFLKNSFFVLWSRILYHGLVVQHKGDSEQSLRTCQVKEEEGNECHVKIPHQLVLHSRLLWC